MTQLLSLAKLHFFAKAFWLHCKSYFVDKSTLESNTKVINNSITAINEKQKLTQKELKILTDIANTSVSECVNIKESLNTFIKKVASDFVNYYTKTEVYNQREIDSKVNDLQGKISALPKFAITVVQSLPTTNISSTTIYLLRNSDNSQNTFSEYIYVNGAWELLGSAKMDLTDYYKKGEVYSRQEIETQNKAINDRINEAFAKFPEIVASIQQTNSTIASVNKRVGEVDKKFIEYSKSAEIEQNYAKKEGDENIAFSAKILNLAGNVEWGKIEYNERQRSYYFTFSDTTVYLPEPEQDDNQTIAFISNIPQPATEAEVEQLFNSLD